MTGDTAPRDDRSTLERMLGVFTEVKPGEGGTALLLTLNIFLLLTAYYVIKPVREGLILAMGDSGARYKSYMSAAIAIALTGAVPAYAAYAKRVARNRLVVGVTLFFVSHLAVFFGLTFLPSSGSWLGLVFYLWVGIFNMMVVAQFWAFANDVYTSEQGERLFALIGIGASTGAVAGSAITDLLIEVVGESPLLLLAGAILGACAAITQVVHRREARPPVPPPRRKIKSQLKDTEVAGFEAKEPDIEAQLKSTAVASDGATADAEESEDADAKERQKPEGEAKPSKSESFAMVFRYRYLTYLAVFSLLFSLINTNGEFILSSVVGDAAQEAFEASGKGADLSGEALEQAAQKFKKVWIGGFYGEFFLYVNILGVILQSFVVSRVVKRFGVNRALFVFPVVALLGAVSVAIVPVLLAVRIAKTFENATDYSFNNTVRNMLWLPTTREMKYQAKQAVDTFFVRSGDVISAGFVFVLAAQLAFGTRVFAIANVVLCVLLVLVCVRLLGARKELLEMKERGELPED